MIYIRVVDLIEYVLHPFETSLWYEHSIISTQDVDSRIQYGVYESRHFEDTPETVEYEYDDAARIAHFVKEGIIDPISIEITSLDGNVFMHDGYHRLAAAIYRNDILIPVDIGGYIDHTPFQTF